MARRTAAASTGDSAETSARPSAPASNRRGTTFRGGRGQPGWGTTRYAGNSPADISKAKEELSAELDTFEDYEEQPAAPSALTASTPQDPNSSVSSDATGSASGRLGPSDSSGGGEPLWAFLQSRWPYGYPDRALDDIFQRALTLNRTSAKTKGNYCPVETTIRRAGFAKADLTHVMLTFELGFKTMLALELHGSGHRCLSRSRKSTMGSQQRIHDVLKSNPVIKKWLEPTVEYYDALRDATANAADNGLTQVAVRYVQLNFAADGEVSPESATELYLRKVAKNVHHHFVSLAVDSIMQQFWQAATATWLASNKQANATTRSQWEDLRNRCYRDTALLEDPDEPQTEDGIWLPLYADGMAGDEASLLQTSISYGCELHERRAELQAARDAEEARQAALTAEAKRRLAAKRSKRKGKAASSSAKRAKRSRAPPQPEDMDEEQDELESDSEEEEVVQAETDAEEALRSVGRQVKPDTWRTKAEGKTWKHVSENPTLVKHLTALKDVPKDVSFTDIVAVKVDLEDTSGSIAVDQEAGQVEHDIRGIDGDLTSDECLRAFTYLFRTYPDAAAIRTADSFAIPSKAALAQYEPFDLTELGFRTHPLDAKLDKALRQPLTLSETQLQSGIWFFRKVAFDIRETSALRQQMEALSDEELFDRRDWSTGGIVADPPGLGKTVIAILFALIYRKLKVSNKPCLFIVKTSVSQQFGKEVFRFVDVTLGDVSDGELHLLSLTDSNYEGKRVPRDFKANDRTMWNADLLVVVSNKNTAPKAKKDPRLPFHASWKYGLVCYDEVHDLPQTTAGTFSLEYNVQREFTVGFSGTPIRNVEHFLFVMAFCGHPAAKIRTAEKARSLGRAISNSMTLDEADKENVGRVFRDNILQWTTQRDVALIGRGGDLTALETLVSRLYGERMPQEQDEPMDEPMRALHVELLKEFLKPIRDSAETAARELSNVKAHHQKFHKQLRERYIFPMGDRSAGPFVLKRPRAASDRLPELHEFNVTIEQEPRHGKWLHTIEQRAKDQSVAFKMTSDAEKHPQMTEDYRAAQKRLYQERADQLVKNPSYQHYAVYHPALLAASLQDGDKEEREGIELDQEIQDSLEQLPSKKGLLVAALTAHILCNVDKLFQFPAGCPTLPIDPSSLPPRLPEGSRPQKIIIFAFNGQIAMFIMWFLQRFEIGLLNLYGGDSFDALADRIESWAHTPTVPVMIISAALATGINMTQANILIFAQGCYNELEDHQVKGRIHRTGQTRQCYVYKPRVASSHDDSVRFQGKAKTLNQAPFEGTSSKILEFCEASSFAPRMRSWEQWAVKAGFGPEERPLTWWHRGGSMLPSLGDNAEDRASTTQTAGSLEAIPEEPMPPA